MDFKLQLYSDPPYPAPPPLTESGPTLGFSVHTRSFWAQFVSSRAVCISPFVSEDAIGTLRGPGVDCHLLLQSPVLAYLPVFWGPAMLLLPVGAAWHATSTQDTVQAGLSSWLQLKGITARTESNGEVVVSPILKLLGHLCPQGSLLPAGPEPVPTLWDSFLPAESLFPHFSIFPT